MIRNKSWWDTVDIIASNLVGSLVTQFPQLSATMDNWISDEHLWVRRTALIHQLKYKAATNTDRLYSYIGQLMHEQDFFIRKAIGWALREYSKTDPDSVRDFIAANDSELSSLSKREGSKYV
eukprot:TRINITY_DN4057_c0_g1_i2.p1 TRINITY_DN4057_c0_g1~~TRINITY_DN4057_c0_g1_i2.p1  ORF type:complete len:122 (+),score=10.59 TRINITY_DN4057_c0_g1_i2:413-778(+)